MKHKDILSTISLLTLRLAVFAIGLVVLLICIFGLPAIWSGVNKEYSQDLHAVLYAIVIAAYVAALPFYVALLQALKLLNLISKGKAFSKTAIKYINITARCAFAISFVYVVALPLFYLWAENDDAPGLIIVCMVLAGTPFILGVFMTVVQRLLSQAVHIKKENDLTV